MKNFKFECETECRENDEIGLDRVIMEIYFKRINRKSSLYYMEFNCETMDDMHVRIVKNPYQILCEYLCYNSIHLKNHLAKYYECKLYEHHHCFPEHQVERVIEWLTSFKVMSKLTE